MTTDSFGLNELGILLLECGKLVLERDDLGSWVASLRRPERSARIRSSPLPLERELCLAQVRLELRHAALKRGRLLNKLRVIGRNVGGGLCRRLELVLEPLDFGLLGLELLVE